MTMKMKKKLRKGGWAIKKITAYGGGVDLSSDGRDNLRHQEEDAAMTSTMPESTIPVGDGSSFDDTLEVELNGRTRRTEGQRRMEAEMGHDIQELTDSQSYHPRPKNPYLQFPADAYTNYNEDTGAEMHLGKAMDKDDDLDDSSSHSTNPTFDGVEPEDGQWQHAPDLSTNPVVVHDDLGQANANEDYRSPFVKVFQRIGKG